MTVEEWSVAKDLEGMGLGYLKKIPLVLRVLLKYHEVLGFLSSTEYLINAL
jgi:hypothetical protein